MEYLIGIFLALAAAALAALSGLDRDRAFSPTVLIVVASYYALFAVLGASTRALLLETAGAAVFTSFGLYGFQKNLHLVAAAIAGHGLFDLVHHHLIANPGLPHYWPGFCASFDLVFGAWLAFRAKSAAPRRP